MINEEKIAELADEYGMTQRKVTAFYDAIKYADCVVNGYDEQELRCLESIISTIDSRKEKQDHFTKRSTDEYIIADALYDSYSDLAIEVINEICPEYLRLKAYDSSYSSFSDSYSEESGNYNKTLHAKQLKRIISEI